ncbi:hypothetical protein [Streptomyces sp. NPDC059649]|uniref:hypothetical protein n=1 Tax=Streptomyces sp. NPDC059649 TaxID=3346895 RepID=UPI0036797B13
MALALVLLLVLGALGYGLWPRGEANGQSDGAGSGTAQAAAAHAESAARALKALPAVKVSVDFVPSRLGDEARPRTHAALTVTAEGQAGGTLREAVSGKADVAWKDGRLYLKGDPEFWAQQPPQYAHDVKGSGKWVAPQKRSGYYMLNHFSVDVGSLKPASLAALVRQVTSDPGAVKENAGNLHGRAALSYTASGWTVLISSEAPYTVLGIAGSPLSTGAVRSAGWTPLAHRGGGVVAAAFRPHAVPVDDPSGFFNPYLIVTPQTATEKEAQAVRGIVTGATSDASAEGMPGAPGQTDTAAPDGPQFDIDETSSRLCTTRECPVSLTITNTGDQPADATLYINAPGTSGKPFPLGTLAPKQSKSVNTGRPNQAPPGQTVTVWIHAFVYSSVLYGPDPSVVDRLRARGLDPTSQLSVAAPLLPAAVKLLDQMTHGSTKPQETVNTQALKALNTANGQGQLPLLSQIVNSGRLMTPLDLPDVINNADKIGSVNSMLQVAHLLETDPAAKVWLDGPYMANGRGYKTDYLYTTTKDGKEVKRSVQVKTITSHGKVNSNATKGAKQLNGEVPGRGGNLPEEAPPGFDRVLQLYFEPEIGDYYTATRDKLTDYLSGKRFQGARQGFCNDDGKPRIDELVIINGTGTHTWTDLKEIKVPC